MEFTQEELRMEELGMLNEDYVPTVPQERMDQIERFMDENHDMLVILS